MSYPNPLTHVSADVRAVVVAFRPDADFGQRIESTLPQVAGLLVVDNTPEGGCVQSLAHLAAAWPGLVVKENRANLGVAAALNQGLDWARSGEAQWLLTLDQDSRVFSDLVETLVNVAATAPEKPMVVGGNYLDPRNNRLDVPREGSLPFEVRKTVITSGSLVRVDAALEIGGFREDYFIDQLDHEFCLRARRHGYQILISRKPVMEHSVGEAGGVRLPFLGTLPNHSPLRKYYIARNSIVTILEYWREEPGWCARRLVKLCLGAAFMLLLEEERLAKIRAFISGTWDGLAGRLGPHREGGHEK